MMKEAIMYDGELFYTNGHEGNCVCGACLLLKPVPGPLASVEVCVPYEKLSAEAKAYVDNCRKEGIR